MTLPYIVSRSTLPQLLRKMDRWKDPSKRSLDVHLDQKADGVTNSSH
jgi:hypothetical protein